jgi:hypothetical protein
LQRVNNKAFKNAIALAAQIQNTSHMIIVKNLTRELYFILESQIQSLSDVIGYYHDSDTKVIKITVHSNNFKTIRKVIQQSLSTWNDMLDPSDTRVSGYPTIVPVSSDDYSESENSQLSGSMESLLSLDLTAFAIFHSQILTDVTIESYKTTIEMQNEKIGKQEAQIEFLIHTIQQLNSNMNHKFERMLHLITHKHLEETHQDSKMLEFSQGDPPNNTATESKSKHISQPPKKQKVSLAGNRRH